MSAPVHYKPAGWPICCRAPYPSLLPDFKWSFPIPKTTTNVFSITCPICLWKLRVHLIRVCEQEGIEF